MGSLHYYFFYDWDITWTGGCNSTRSTVIATVGCVSQEEKSSDKSVMVYPNPVHQGSVHIWIKNAGSQGGQVQLVNMLGEVVHEKTFSSSDQRLTFNMTTDQDGVYFVKVITGKTYAITKVVKTN